MSADTIQHFLETAQTDPALRDEVARIYESIARQAAGELAKLSVEENLPFTAEEFLEASAASVLESQKELPDSVLADINAGFSFTWAGAAIGGIIGGVAAVGLAVAAAPFVGMGAAAVGTGALIWSVVGGASTGSTVGGLIDAGIDLANGKNPFD